MIRYTLKHLSLFFEPDIWEDGSMSTDIGGKDYEGEIFLVSKENFSKEQWKKLERVLSNLLIKDKNLKKEKEDDLRTK